MVLAERKNDFYMNNGVYTEGYLGDENKCDILFILREPNSDGKQANIFWFKQVVNGVKFNGEDVESKKKARKANVSGTRYKNVLGRIACKLLNITYGNYGYRLCVETKIGDWFHADQIKGHLEAFNKLDTTYKLLLSLSTVDECGIAPEIKDLVDAFNKVNNLCNEERLIYRHLTFEKLIEMMEGILSECDYEFVDILNDYKEYCTEQGLIDDRYQLMKAYAVGATIEINKKLNLYYRTATDNVKSDILGMYKDKEIVAIGKIYKVVKAFMPEDELLLPDGEALSKDEKDRIIEAIMDARKYGYDLRNVETKFYLVENFEKCSFKKKSKWGLRGGRNFKLETDYGIAEI